MARGHESGCSAESYAEASHKNTRGTRIRGDSRPLAISKLNIQTVIMRYLVSIATNLHLFLPISSTSCPDWTRFRINVVCRHNCRVSRKTKLIHPKPTIGLGLRWYYDSKSALTATNGSTARGTNSRSVPLSLPCKLSIFPAIGIQSGGMNLRKSIALHGSPDPVSVDRRLASYSAPRNYYSSIPPRFLLAFGEQKPGRSGEFRGLPF